MRLEEQGGLISIRKSDACMGGEVSGVDLSRPQSDGIFDEVRDALHRHHVLVFRGQSLEPQNFLKFASGFGMPDRICSTSFIIPVHGHLGFRMSGRTQPIGSLMWHVWLPTIPICRFRRAPRCCTD